jgi:NADP-dependent 3-hydroxy acid dehydrogenase YdfG
MKPLAVITGAASGIGRASSLELAKAGYTILAIDRNEKTLNEFKTFLTREDQKEIVRS